MAEKTSDQVKKIVREGYAKVAQQDNSCCGTPASAPNISKQIGYTEEELKSVPEGTNLSLGCGNPVALVSLREGEVVLDLGSGAGFDCFLAASQVGQEGRVIGVDMTPEMIDRARGNAGQGNYRNVEFRLGEIENLPVADKSVDVVISNCVINLSTNKARVFSEAFRVLKPRGRLMVSDIALLRELPHWLKNSIAAYVGCLSGAVMRDKYVEAITAAGFTDVRIIDETVFPIEYMANDPTAQAIARDAEIPMAQLKELAEAAVSIKVSGIKPAPAD